MKEAIYEVNTHDLKPEYFYGDTVVCIDAREGLKTGEIKPNEFDFMIQLAGHNPIIREIVKKDDEAGILHYRSIFGGDVRTVALDEVEQIMYINEVRRPKGGAYHE